MKGQATISIVYMSVGILIALVIMYFLYSYLTSSSLETITSPFVITNFILNNFQEQTAGSCSFAISFDANQNINLASIHAGFLLSNGDYLYPSYGNYTQTTSFINAGQYLYYLKPNIGWSGYNGTVCKFLSTAITSKSNYITGMTRVIDNKTKIFQRFTGNVEFLVNTPNTNPQDIYGDSVIGITATHNLGVVIIKGITNSTFSEDTTPGTYIYLPAGKYKIEYTNEGTSAIFLEWSSDGGVSIQNPSSPVTNMTVINNGQIVIDNTLSLIPPVNFSIIENQTKTPVENKVNVTADYVSGYYTFYVNKAPYSSCIDTLNKTCIITESSSGTYNITASYKSSTIYGISNELQESFYIPIYHFNIIENQTKTLSGKNVDITVNNTLENYTFYVNNVPYQGCINVESKSCIITESSPGTYNITASYNSSTSDGISNTLQEVFYVYPYVYISIDNTQSIATPSPFQQEIIFNADNYTQYESSNLGNIRIFNSQNQQVNFWCESGCYNTSTKTIIFLKLQNGIPALALKQYKMEFLNKTVNYNGTTAGEAPELSGAWGTSTFGKYDNGANVFISYAQADGSVPSGYNNSGEPTTPSLKAPSSFPFIADIMLNPLKSVEDDVEYYPNGALGNENIQVVGSLRGSGASEYFLYLWNNSKYFNGNSFPTNTIYGNYIVSSVNYITSTNWTGYINYNEINSSTITGYSTTPGGTVANGGGNQYYFPSAYWIDIRSYPPNGVMPTVSFGNIQQ